MYLVVLVLPTDNLFFRRVFLQVLHVFTEVKRLQLYFINLLFLFLAPLFVFFIRSIIFHKVLFPFLVLFDLFVEKLSNFVLLFLDWFGLEDHQGAPNLHASGGTGSHLCWALVEYERTKLWLLVLEPEFTLAEVDLTVVTRYADVADFEIAILTSSDTVETFEIEEISNLWMQNVNHSGCFYV